MAAEDGFVEATRPATLVPLRPKEAQFHDPRLSDVDEWGRSQHMRAIVRQVYGPLYRSWFRVEWQGLEKIPTSGGALLIANHAGAIPSDAPVIMHGIEEELDRPVYGLADHIFKTVPVIGTLWSRLGGVAAHPDNAFRLLRQQRQVVLVFPEGAKGPGKLYQDRYRLRRFGRGGFVEMAMRSGVPYVPITANHLVLGPVLGTVGYFPAKFKLRVLDPVTFEEPPEQERYSRGRVMEEAEAIRVKLQDNLFDMLRARHSVWFG